MDYTKIFAYIMLGALAFFSFIFYKTSNKSDKATIILDERYDNPGDLALAVMNYLESKDKICRLLNERDNGYYQILMDNQIYILKSKTISIGGFPTQIVKLKAI